MNWANLIRAFRLVTWQRVLLCAWEFLLWGILWAAGHYLPWWGFAVGAGVAFVLHEVGFQSYALLVCRVAECYEAPTWIGTGPTYTPCLERWTGPVA